MEHNVIIITSKNNISDNPTARWMSDAIRELAQQISKWDLHQDHWYVSKTDYDDIVKWGL